MQGQLHRIEVEPVPIRWGRQPLYSAKVGTGSSCLVMIRRSRKFYLKQFVSFCTLEDVNGMSVGMTPPWRRGRITKIDERWDMLFIEAR